AVRVAATGGIRTTKHFHGPQQTERPPAQLVMNGTHFSDDGMAEEVTQNSLLVWSEGRRAIVTYPRADFLNKPPDFIRHCFIQGQGSPLETVRIRLVWKVRTLAPPAGIDTDSVPASNLIAKVVDTPPAEIEWQPFERAEFPSGEPRVFAIDVPQQQQWYFASRADRSAVIRHTPRPVVTAGPFACVNPKPGLQDWHGF